MEVTYQFPDRVMASPSLLVSGQHAWSTIDKVSGVEELDFFLPETFVQFVDQEGYQASQSEPHEQPPILRYYAQRATTANLSDVGPRLYELFDVFSAEDYLDDYSELYNSLADTLPYSRDRISTEQSYYGSGSNTLVDSTFEELVFLLENSGWVSRTKRLVNDALDAGIHFTELSEDRVDDFFEKHTKSPEAVKKDLVKSIGKWVVVSTTGLSTYQLGGPIFGLVSAKSVDYAWDATFLLLFDPV